jgi:hypothetical protein
MTEGCGLAPSISSEWRAAYASRNWACAATGRIADSSSEAAREECSLDSRVVSLRAWHWRETADCSRSEWARPASNVPFAKRRTSSAWASPETADGFPGDNLRIPYHMSTSTLACFSAPSASEGTFPSREASGGGLGVEPQLVQPVMQSQHRFAARGLLAGLARVCQIPSARRTACRSCDAENWCGTRSCRPTLDHV